MILPSRCRLFLSGLAVTLLGACDRPTAPQARDQIENAERGVLEGRLSLGDLHLEKLLYNSVGPYMWFPADTLTVERDGETTRYLAHVVERVYLPPSRAGGRPYVKRTLLAWDKENHRGLAFAADDSVADIVSPTRRLTAEDTPERIWRRPAFAVQSERDARDAWFGTEGRVDFGVATKVGPCSLTQGNVGARFPIMDTDPGLTTTCDDVRFTMTGATLLEKRRTPERAGFLARWTSSKMSVRFDNQSVRGTRITTQCPDEPNPRTFLAWECYTYLLFWRDQTQFAAGLGLDVTRIEQPHDQDPYVQMLTAGVGGSSVSAPVHGVACCTAYAGPAHYTVRAPDGRTLRETDVAIASDDSLLKSIYWSSMSDVRDGMRALVLIPAIRFDHSMSRWAPLIIDLTILPCPAGKRRDNVSAPGNAYPAGGCYPTR